MKEKGRRASYQEASTVAWRKSILSKMWKKEEAKERRNEMKWEMKAQWRKEAKKIWNQSWERKSEAKPKKRNESRENICQRIENEERRIINYLRRNRPSKRKSEGKPKKWKYQINEPMKKARRRVIEWKRVIEMTVTEREENKPSEIWNNQILSANREMKLQWQCIEWEEREKWPKLKMREKW